LSSTRIVLESRPTIPIRRTWHLLCAYLRPQWRRVALLGLLVAASTGLSLVAPQMMRRFIDTAIATASKYPPNLLAPDVSGASPNRVAPLTHLALAYLGIALLKQLARLAITYLGETTAWTATNGLRRDLTAHCLQLDMSFHKTHTPGELIERLDGDVGTLATFFSVLAVQLVSSVLLAAGILVALAIEDWRVGLVGLAYAGLIASVVRSVQQRAVEAWGASRQAGAELFGFMGERLVATEDIRANGGEGHVIIRLAVHMRAVAHHWRRAKMVQATSRAASGTAQLATRLGALGIGIALLLRGEMTVGTVYLLMAYFAQLRQPVDAIRGQMDNLQQASASIDRIESLRGTQSKVHLHAGSLGDACHLPLGALSVAFEGVTFRYQDTPGSGGLQPDRASQSGDWRSQEDVLRDLSFELAPGRVLGLLGRTGSGKTTLTRLLFRLYAPNTGAVRLGGVDLGDVESTALRRRVGLVTQDVQLFRGTVRDNVALFDETVGDDRILDAVRELGLWEWFERLPEGLDTPLLTGGQSLSAGEAQLLAFCRVYLVNPGLVVLDEASSRLDPATEGLLERAIDRLLRGRTAIVVAHRLGTVARADEIMILSEGRVGEHGDRAALGADPSSRFSRLLRTGMGEVLA